MCYTSGDSAELFLNGESLERREKRRDPPPVVGKGDAGYYAPTECYRLTWEVPYEAGELRVVAFRDGHAIGQDVRKTAEKAFSVRLTPEARALDDGRLGFVKVEVVDEYGTALPLAQDEVKLALEGQGEIVAVCNGATSDMKSFADTASCRLYNGRGLVVVRRNPGSGKPLRLSASVPGLRTERLVIPRR